MHSRVSTRHTPWTVGNRLEVRQPLTAQSSTKDCLLRSTRASGQCRLVSATSRPHRQLGPDRSAQVRYDVQALPPDRTKFAEDATKCY
jgi:hypothetical protein